MLLQTFYHARLNNQSVDYGIEAIASDEELATHIQEVLIWLKFLDPPADGKFGPISSNALVEFQDVMKSSEPAVSEERGFLGVVTARLLIETSPDEVPKPEVDLTKNNLEARIIAYMLKMNYRVSVGPQRYNIVYVEGMNADGSLNDDAPNHFNDRRLVIEIPNEVPILRQNWEGTTEPGTAYTLNPMKGRAKEFGAARIAFGQYKAWKVGTHWGSGAEPHEALEQVSPVSVYRDKNKDFIRKGDFLDTGMFDINQHYGFDYPRNDIGYAGAGCLVGRTRQGHRDFMALIKQDKRYQLNKEYRFVTTIIPGDDLVKQFPG
ncbi:peptidoglycan-binding domain-containing protein [Coleofasciculus sp. FACHB-1120]|uniref:peptidoglycan-binding domain-containing protein n=1 Tax=Coleofasciculus sp. FACHB-1120 TaxID=2692783 RepID=UPI001687986C|nr:peptidoglycan-binding domain-containing protein [Coleofasciculus sp. FACHB-1120]MBD2741451.1 peptidoglycan-binding protein [Coleofasciculus sp. FACHB-1120]